MPYNIFSILILNSFLVNKYFYKPLAYYAKAYYLCNT